MATVTYRSGALQVFLPSDRPDITSNGLNTLVMTASAEDYVTANNNDRCSNLDTTATYRCIITGVWHDPTNLGLGITAGSPATGYMSPTSGQGLLLSVNPGAWPSNYAYASGIAIWVEKNASDQFKLHSIVAPDTSNVWSTMVFCEPGTDAITRTSAFLLGVTTDSTFPKRTGLVGCEFNKVGETQGGVTLEDTAEQIQYRPDLSTNYSLAITRGLKITFSTLNNALSDFIKARAGEYVKFTNGANTYEIGLRNYQAAGAVSTGNRPIKILFPIDSHKAVEEMYAYASLKENQSGGTSSWGKENPPVLDYTIETINQDTALQGVFSTASRILYAT